MTATKRCPRCGQTKPASQFYRRRRDELSSYCQPCAQTAAREARSRRQHDPASAVRLRAIDRARQRRRRYLDRQGGEGR
jgi:recombinational DNA repair protein (RecF pathway)